jgi:bacteriorhodopsin
VSGLITFIAAVHYFYMRDYWGANQESPTFFRYVDWILTVPLMCVEFYLILKVAGATKKLMWTLIGASVVMLVTGYFGEAVYPGNAAVWGLISGLAYFYIVYLIMFGEAKTLATKAGGQVLASHNMLCKFVLIGWAIYPLGYMIGTASGQWYSFMDIGIDMDVIYNIGDAINKIGFGLVVYSLAVNSTKEA